MANEKEKCFAKAKFIAYLINQRVLHEIIALRILHLALQKDLFTIQIGGFEAYPVVHSGLNLVANNNQNTYMLELLYIWNLEPMLDKTIIKFN
ncbi:unnamed protein product [Rotaria magnacalcarata]|uniref:Uncharacterized protein n=1 Tax=Rotaria magnacalcarata TaxID=392030 RepID=A0A8S2Q8V0_9BILA|nr:unnamed protein product [Rotaria magnacalcarata]